MDLLWGVNPANGLGTLIEGNTIQNVNGGFSGIYDALGGCVVRNNTTFGHGVAGIHLASNASRCQLNRTNDGILDSGVNTIGSGATANVSF